jgi:CBS-domain-containing membrane protein
MKASEVMTRKVISIAPEATIVDAIRLMLRKRISGLPVVDRQGRLVGIVSEGDFLHRPELSTARGRSAWFDAIFGPSESAKNYVHSHGSKVRDVMTGDPVTVSEHTPLDQLVHLMETHRIKRLPVVRRGKVVGIVTRADLMLALASIHRTARASSATNGAIRQRILSAIREQTWTAGASIDVTVSNGVVDLWGTINDIAQRDALKALVAATPGVREVADHLVLHGMPVAARHC